LQAVGRFIAAIRPGTDIRARTCRREGARISMPPEGGSHLRVILMAATDPASTVSAAGPGSGHPGGQTDAGGRSDPHGRSEPQGRSNESGWSDQSGPRSRGGAMAAAAVARAAVRAPGTSRARREFLFCLAGLPDGLANPVVVFFVVVDLIWGVTTHRPANPSWPDVAAAIVVTGLLLALLVAMGAARELGSLQRLLAARLLGARIATPPPVRRSPGRLGGLGPGLRDGADWRAVAYLAVKLPVVLLGLYAVFFWAAGQPQLPVLVGGVPQPSAGGSAEPGAGVHTVRLVRPGDVPGRHPSRHLCRGRRGRGDDAGRSVGDQGGRVRGPVADPGPARARRAGAARA
jgi:Putative sensor